MYIYEKYILYDVCINWENLRQFIKMLLTAVALLSGLNASRVSVDDKSYEIISNYMECGTSFFMESITDWSSESIDECFYLDYGSSITLTVDGSKYKNPIFFCPNGASNIKFEPDDGIYCAGFIFAAIISELSSCNGLNRIYVITESTNFKTPVAKAKCDGTIEYYDLVLAPVPAGAIALSGTAEAMSHYESESMFYILDSTKQSSTASVTVSSGANYTIKRSMNKRYSISIPSTGPYVFNGKSGLSIGVIVGIAVGAVVVVGAVVGVSVYFISKNRKKDKGDESSSSSSW